MDLQYISDENGNRTAVIIPIEIWESKFKQFDDDLSKEEIKEDLREAIKEVKLYKQGKVKLQSARDFLHELSNNPI